MKKYISALLVLLLASVLVACAADPDASEEAVTDESAVEATEAVEEATEAMDDADADADMEAEAESEADEDDMEATDEADAMADDEAMAETPLPIGLWEQCETPDLSGTITFGAPLGLTGPISVYGVPEQQGVDLAIAEINESGYLGDAQIEMIYEDTEGDAQQAINAMTKLIEEDNVVAVFGPSLSSEAFAADPIAQEAGIPTMGVTTSAIGIPQIGDYIFRGNLPEQVLIPIMVEEVQTLYNIQDVAVLYGDDDDFTVTGYNVFIEALDGSGINITNEATFARGDVDFNPQLTTLVTGDNVPDALVVSALAAEGIQIIVQARALGYEGLILGGNGFNSPDIASEAGEDATNLIVGASWNIGGGNDLSQRFVSLFEEEYGRQPDQFSVQAYTVMWIFATAIRCEGSAESDAIRDGLFNIQDFASPLGDFSFDGEGEPFHEPVVQIFDAGDFVPLTEDLVDPALVVEEAE
ncbi:MAG: ABC transporter substrate-binding protein [Chloroflexota bacterium]